jgi:hypothetical protein
MISSVKLFQAWQAGHFPVHFAASYPHSLQKNAFFTLLMTYILG